MGMVWLLIPMIGLILIFIVVGYFLYKKYRQWKENKAAQAAQVSSVTSASVAIPTPAFSVSPTIFNSPSDDYLAESAGEAYYSSTGARIPGQSYVSNLVMPPTLENQESEGDSLYDTTDSEKRRVYPAPIHRPIPRAAKPSTSQNIRNTPLGQNSKGGGEVVTGSLSLSTESEDFSETRSPAPKSEGGEILQEKNVKRTPAVGFEASPILPPKVDINAPQMQSTAQSMDSTAEKKVLSPKGRYVNATNLADTDLSPQNDFFQIEQFPPLESTPLEFVESESLSIENPFKKPTQVSGKHRPPGIIEENNGTPPRNQKNRQSRKNAQKGSIR